MAELILPLRTELPEEILERQDEVQPICVAVPLYNWVSSMFFANFVRMHRVEETPVCTVVGVYLEQAMRLLTKQALAIPGWKRLVIVEGDMVMPEDALIRHALHTDAVVGSLYFQHRLPHQANVMLEHPTEGVDKCAHLLPTGIKYMLDNPALYKVSIVGMGCTSIRRDVLEDWDHERWGPIWRNGFQESAKDDEFTGGQISHDVRFCQQVVRQGHSVWLDSSIVCDQLTEGNIGARHYLAAHAQELGLIPEHLRRASSPIVLPNRAARRQHARARAT
ncbi:MAG TPA: hypothetical protein VGY32_11480 [Solirubrobacteraceae bacterium]|jgi:hypothetical protein|nr:hypothetical protein [Solirubrobacteraceae bacterium]